VAIEDGTSLARAEALKVRTKQYALRIIRLIKSLPRTEEGRVIGNQLLRSGTAVGANYRAVCRARSQKEFIAKMGVVVEESDESAYWIELLGEGGVVRQSRLTSLLDETNQLLAIFAASHHSAKKGLGE
jgi:four helix bundle protein